MGEKYKTKNQIKISLKCRSQENAIVHFHMAPFQKPKNCNAPNAHGSRSHGTASSDTIPLQKMKHCKELK